MSQRSLRGANLRRALAVAQSLGCTIRQPHATGDLVVSHPRLTRSVRVSRGRKDSPRGLTSLINRIRRIAR